MHTCIHTVTHTHIHKQTYKHTYIHEHVQKPAVHQYETQTYAKSKHDTRLARHFTNVSNHMEYIHTIHEECATPHNRHWPCPNISSQPDTDSARQKVGQANCVLRKCCFQKPRASNSRAVTLHRIEHAACCSSRSLSTPAEIVHPASFQTLRHATDQLLQEAPLVARWHVRVRLEEMRHPRTELVLREHATGTKISLLSHGEISPQLCPECFDGVEVSTVWWEADHLQAVAAICGSIDEAYLPRKPEQPQQPESLQGHHKQKHA